MQQIYGAVDEPCFHCQLTGDIGFFFKYGVVCSAYYVADILFAVLIAQIMPLIE